MLYFSHRDNRPISAIIALVFLIIYYFKKKWSKTGFQFPKSYLIKHTYYLWFTAQLSVVLSLVLLPLGLSYISSNPSIQVIFDNSLSMSSQDITPTRLERARKIVQKLSAQVCIALQQEVLDGCATITSLQWSWTNITDAILLAAQKSSDRRVVLTDGGANYGIAFDQLMKDDVLRNSLIWVDVVPSTGNIIISWVVVANQVLWFTKEQLDDLPHYLSVAPSDAVGDVVDRIKDIIQAQTPWYSSISFILVGVVVLGLGFLTIAHFITLVKRGLI